MKKCKITDINDLLDLTANVLVLYMVNAHVNFCPSEQKEEFPIDMDIIICPIKVDIIIYPTKGHHYLPIKVDIIICPTERTSLSAYKSGHHHLLHRKDIIIYLQKWTLLSAPQKGHHYLPTKVDIIICSMEWTSLSSATLTSKSLSDLLLLNNQSYSAEWNSMSLDFKASCNTSSL